VVVGVLGLPKVMVTEYIIFVYKVGLTSWWLEEKWLGGGTLT